MKILMIVPAYNEEKNLPRVIRDLREHIPYADIAVVNDGSRDATASIASGLGVKVLSLPFNLGIGGAMQTGYKYAMQHNYDIAIQFDGDGQHMAGEIEKLLQPIQERAADFIVGSRFIDPGKYKPSLFRKMGISVFSAAVSLILGIRVTDTTSGFRAANRRVIEFFSNHYPDDYPEAESIVLLHKAGLSVAEVPVRMQQRIGGRSSINAVRSVYYMVKVFMAILIDLFKKMR